MEPRDQHIGYPGTSPADLAPEPFSVMGVEREADDVVTISLARDNQDTFSFRPGQFNMLYLFGAGDVPISIASDRAAGSELKHTIRAAGGLTERFVEQEPGDTVGVRGPFGSAWPLDRAEGKDLLLITGGIGLAPLRTAVYELLDRRDSFGRVSLLYGAKTPDQILYEDDLNGWEQRSDLDVRVTVDSADRTWKGPVGVVTNLIPSADFDPENVVVFTCGPEIMMTFVIDELSGLGVEHDQVFVSMERNMECAVSHCGHCQLGPEFICKDGPVLNFERIASFFPVRNF